MKKVSEEVVPSQGLSVPPMSASASVAKGVDGFASAELYESVAANSDNISLNQHTAGQSATQIVQEEREMLAATATLEAAVESASKCLHHLAQRHAVVASAYAASLTTLNEVATLLKSHQFNKALPKLGNAFLEFNRDVGQHFNSTLVQSPAEIQPGAMEDLGRCVRTSFDAFLHAALSAGEASETWIAEGEAALIEASQKAIDAYIAEISHNPEVVTYL